MEDDATAGVNVYCWGEKNQDRFLTERLRPYVESLNRTRQLRRFWYDRANQRGPHLFILFDAHGKRLDEIHAELAAVAHDHFQANPPPKNYSTSELELLHLDAGGKILCEIDDLPGLAPNNSTIVFKQHESDYPFTLFETGDADMLWKATCDMCLLTLRQLADAPKTVYSFAARMALAFDARMYPDAQTAAAYWSYHAATLINNFQGHLVSHGNIERLLIGAFGERGLAFFKNEYLDLSRAKTDDQIEMVLTALQAAHPTRAFFRELLHVFFKQLGITTRQQIAIVLLLLYLRTNERKERRVADF